MAIWKYAPRLHDLVWITTHVITHMCHIKAMPLSNINYTLIFLSALISSPFTIDIHPSNNNNKPTFRYFTLITCYHKVLYCVYSFTQWILSVLQTLVTQPTWQTINSQLNLKKVIIMHKKFKLCK